MSYRILNSNTEEAHLEQAELNRGLKFEIWEMFPRVHHKKTGPKNKTGAFGGKLSKGARIPYDPTPRKGEMINFSKPIEPVNVVITEDGIKEVPAAA